MPVEGFFTSLAHGSFPPFLHSAARTPRGDRPCLRLQTPTSKKSCTP